jgi:hypothetical protein
MINKVAGVILLVLGWAFGAVWVFNHINAWAGIGLVVVGLVISANQINKKIKQIKKD